MISRINKRTRKGISKIRMRIGADCVSRYKPILSGIDTFSPCQPECELSIVIRVQVGIMKLVAGYMLQ